MKPQHIARLSKPQRVIVVAAAFASLAWTTTILAQSYPHKPVRVLIGFTPGGAVDVLTRMVTQKMVVQSGATFLVENRPGAGGVLATERVAASPADGYTLLMMTAADTALPSLRAKLPYNLERDLAPVSMVAVSPFVLVAHPSLDRKSTRLNSSHVSESRMPSSA